MNDRPPPPPPPPSTLPPLKTDPKYGHYPWWPEDGDAWVHPEDVETARRMIPGPRVWRREGHRGDYVCLSYGETSLRVKRTLWVEAPYEGFNLGDLVEVRPQGMKHDPVTGTVRDMHWDAHAGVVRYYLTTGEGTPLENAFEAHDLKPVEPPQPREESRIEPRDDPDEDPDNDLGILEP